MKKLLLIVLMLLMAIAAPVYADDIKIIVDGQELMMDTQPVIEAGTTLVPMRAIFEALEATVDYQADLRQVIGRKGDNTISLTIDSNTAYKNGEALALAAAPRIIEGRTMVPLRFVSDALGCSVEWNGETRTVEILSVSGKTKEQQLKETLFGPETPTETQAAETPEVTVQRETPSASWTSEYGYILPVEKNEARYVLNTNTGKFHYPGCGSVDDMQEKNKSYTNWNRDDIIGKGYKPCGRCKP